MNNLIEELVEQAKKSVPAGLAPEQWLEVYHTKFAELIVKECYEECKGQMLPEGMAESEGYTYNDGVMDCAIGLLQHFGVEE